MRNFKILLAYDGGRYKGWQRLGNTDNTVQGKLEAVLSRMLGAPAEVIGSGRTDAGVHAMGQVANFHGETAMSCGEILTYLRAYLPEDIGVLSVEEADARFHSRLSAVGKTYEYRIWNSEEPCVFERKYRWVLKEKLDVPAMERAAKKFLGTHDFLAFCSNKHFKKSSVRTLEDIQIIRKGEELLIRVSGNGFLYNMVRIMVGTLVEIGLHQRDAESIPAIFETKKRENAGAMAPAHGLYLMEVRYS